MGKEEAFMRHWFICSAAAIATSISISGPASADPANCRQVRMAEPGWNDLAFTTAVGVTLYDALGYKAESTTLGLNVIYESLKNRDLEVFLGYWDPAMITYYEPYKSTVDQVRVNLEGAKYTFAVPSYVWEAGVRDFKDLHKFADKFDKKLYGIEPGSNQLMLDAIADPNLALSGWEVVESSEVGMLSELARKTKDKQFIVFQGWAPHPMNTMFDFKYLTGGDKFYGANFGAATVSTQVRKGFLEDCPNAGQLLQNLSFDIDLENKGMGFLINDGMAPAEAARAAIKADPQRLDAWLSNVTTFDGKPGLDAVKVKLGL